MKNHSGFSDATYSAICSLLGVDRDGNNTGLGNELHSIYRKQFSTRDSFTIGEVFDALIAEYAARHNNKAA